MKNRYLSIILLSTVMTPLTTQAYEKNAAQQEWGKKINNPIQSLNIKKYSNNMILIYESDGTLKGKKINVNIGEIQVGRELPQEESLEDFYIPIEKLIVNPDTDEVSIQASEESATACNQIKFLLSQDKIKVSSILGFISSPTLCSFNAYNIRQENIATFNILVTNPNEY